MAVELHFVIASPQDRLTPEGNLLEKQCTCECGGKPDARKTGQTLPDFEALLRIANLPRMCGSIAEK
jgi:hypothetical protein